MRTHSVVSVGLECDRGAGAPFTPLFPVPWQPGGELQLSTNCSLFRVPLQRGDVAVGRPYTPHRVHPLTPSLHPRIPLILPYTRFCRCTALATGTA